MKDPHFTYKVRTHDWLCEHPRALMERIDLVKALVELPLAQVAEILTPLNVESLAACTGLMDTFIKHNKER